MTEGAGKRIVQGRPVPFTHPDKLLYPKSGITKADLADYYEAAWPRMAPLLAGRAVTIKRYPRGLGAGGFYQRRVQDWFPDWITSADIPMKEAPERTVREVVIDHPATLVFLVNIGALEVHASLAPAATPDIADMMIFDLDPPADFTDEVRRVALAFRDMLEELGLAVFVKTTGSRGFHVTVPLKPRFSLSATRALARALAERMTRQEPGRLTLNPRKAARGGRILIDIWRNAYAQTAVAPWSTRARDGAPVATPLHWDEMHQGIHPRQWRLSNIHERLKMPDPWADFFTRATDLENWRQTAPPELSAALETPAVQS